MGAIILSKRDLSDELNRTQARYELNRATDNKDTQALADWAKNWGVAALDQANTGAAFKTPDEVTILCSQTSRRAERLVGKANNSEAKREDLIEPIRQNLRDINRLEAMLAGYE